jgi:hypothetical protein
MLMYLQKVISRKNKIKKLFFVGILKVYDENSRIRIQNPDSLVRDMAYRVSGPGCSAPGSSG